MIVIAIVLAVVIVVLAARFIVTKLKNNDQPDLVDAPPSAVGLGSNRLDPGPLNDVMPSPDQYTDGTLAKDNNYDATDDLLDPRNPEHDQWISDHSGNEANVDQGDGDTDGTTSTSS